MNPDKLDALVTANPTADAAAILEKCAADSRTVSPILLAGVGNLAPYFASQGLTSRLQRSAAAIAAQDQASADRLNSFVLYVNGPNGSLDTTDATYAAQTDALFAAMVGLNASDATLGVTAGEQAAIIAMGGGYAVKDATADDVAASMARVAAAKAASSRTEEWNALNNLRFNADRDRVAKLNWLQTNTSTALPADLAALDGFTIPEGS